MANSKLVIRNVPAFDGEYVIDKDRVLNGHEAHFVKNIADVRLGDLDKAMRKGDYDLFVAFAVIAMWRIGKVKRDDIYQAAEAILDGPIDSVTFEQESDARPPDLKQSEPPVTPAASSDSSSVTSNLSGNGHPETTPVSIGGPG